MRRECIRSLIARTHVTEQLVRYTGRFLLSGLVLSGFHCIFFYLHRFKASKVGGKEWFSRTYGGGTFSLPRKRRGHFVLFRQM